MAFIAGKDGVVLLGEENLSAYFRSYDANVQVTVLETTVFSNADRTYVGGLKGGNLSLEGFFDKETDASDEELRALLAQVAGEPITIAPEGFALDANVILFSGKMTRYNISQAVDGMVGIAADFTGDALIGFGVSLHPLQAETATDVETSVDGLASSSNGGVAHLNLTAVTAVGGDTFDVILQQSSNDTWGGEETTLATFTQVTTAKASERVTVAAGTTVERYLRTKWTKGGAGSPSYTFATAFARA